MRAGPFVMNTKQEILQAFADYESGALGGEYYIPGGSRDPVGQQTQEQHHG